MEDRPGINKNIISNKNYLLVRFLLRFFETDILEDIPSFFRAQKDQ